MKKLKPLFGALLILSITLLFTGCGSTFIISFPDSESYKVGSVDGYNAFTNSVNDIEIDWPVGSVTVLTSASEFVSIEEIGEDAVNMPLNYRLSDGVLSIQFASPGLYKNVKSKDLTVTLPSSLTLSNVEIEGASSEIKLASISASELSVETASGNIYVTDLRIDTDITAESASGDITISNCTAVGGIYAECASGGITIKDTTANSVEADTASGNILLSLLGSCNEIQCDSASGRIEATADRLNSAKLEASSGNIMLSVENIPSSIDIETASGDVTLEIPYGGFSFRVDTASGELRCDHAASISSGRYQVGSGGPTYDIETASGDINIRKK
ncbi:MAG: DUF4097 family beta strand repeat protein [Clostridia bacterium]|nr:DUF4097 family beta strand repeat protein [Clostridia bacterium]